MWGGGGGRAGVHYTVTHMNVSVLIIFVVFVLFFNLFFLSFFFFFFPFTRATQMVPTNGIKIQTHKRSKRIHLL